VAIVLASLLLCLAAWRMPGILAGLLLWVLGTWAGRSALRAMGLCGMAVYLTAQYWSLQTTLMTKGLVLLATAAMLLATAAALHRRHRLHRLRQNAAAAAPEAGTGPAGHPQAPSDHPRWPARALAVLGLVLLLGGFNHAVWQKETLLAEGRVVRLELAPRDPRSLLTGDYMTLDYAVARDIRVRLRPELAEQPQDGMAVVRLDPRGVAALVRTQPSSQPLAADELVLLYRLRERQVQLGSNAYFFEEGSAQHYEKARFGEYRVSASGEMILVRLLDEALQPL
jgi:uncharacterized membrane-anchored protein